METIKLADGLRHFYLCLCPLNCIHISQDRKYGPLKSMYIVNGMIVLWSRFWFFILMTIIIVMIKPPD